MTPFKLPLLGFAVRDKTKLKILALVSPFSEKPMVPYVSDFNLCSFT